jgi:hypothetical protein
LTKARATRWAIALQQYENHGAPALTLTAALEGYEVSGVKLALFERQRKKCAWCERRRDFSSSPIEHYRPKNGAWRNLPDEPRVESPGHYWWLTWTWENLLFACPRCNDQGHKANYFPLVKGTAEAPVLPRPAPAPHRASHFDVNGEHPLLLDPSVDDFLAHVRWEPSNKTLARRLWIWTPRALTERGDATIRILKLGELADELQDHLVDHVLSGVEEVEQHLRGRRTKQAAARWSSLLTLLEPDRSFTAATWCALSHWVDAARLAEWKLPAFPRPR